jgi:hypothetical protein
VLLHADVLQARPTPVAGSARGRLRVAPSLLPRAGLPPVDAVDFVGIDRAIRRLYAALSGDAACRRWHEFRALFAAGAKIQLCGSDAAAVPATLAVDELVARAKASPARSLHLVETDRRVRVEGDLAVAESAYDGVTGEGARAAHGRNEVHLRRIERRWRIVLMLCEQHAPAVETSHRRRLGPALRCPPRTPRPRALRSLLAVKARRRP